MDYIIIAHKCVWGHILSPILLLLSILKTVKIFCPKTVYILAALSVVFCKASVLGFRKCPRIAELSGDRKDPWAFCQMLNIFLFAK